MKVAGILVALSFLGSALAAPAVVWKRGENGRALRTSSEIKVYDFLQDILGTDAEVSAEEPSVIFLLGRGDDGSESLSTLASSGAIPNVAEKYQQADAIHHHVSGVESKGSLEKDIGQIGSNKVLSITVGELQKKLSGATEEEEIVVTPNGGMMSKADKMSRKRAKAMKDANVLIVTVDPNADKSSLDDAVVKAIEHEAVSNVVLTAVRSHDEVKRERLLENRRKLSMMPTKKSSTKSSQHRRLEDQEQEENENNNNANNNNNGGDEDVTGVYYVSMTPNILAGILFTLFFAATTWIGVTCMGMIAGQDVYVKKYPTVGREA